MIHQTFFSRMVRSGLILAVCAARLSAQMVDGGEVKAEAPTSTGTRATKFSVQASNALRVEYGSGFSVVALPAGMKPYNLSHSGVVILFDNANFYRWKNGNLELIDTSDPQRSYTNYSKNGELVQETSYGSDRFIMEREDGTQIPINIYTGALEAGDIPRVYITTASSNFAVGRLVVARNPTLLVPVRWDFSGGYLILGASASAYDYPLFQLRIINDRGDFLADKYSDDGYGWGTIINNQHMLEGFSGYDLNNQGSAVLLQWDLSQATSGRPFFWDGSLHPIGDKPGAPSSLNDNDEILVHQDDGHSILWKKTVDGQGMVKFTSTDLGEITGIETAYWGQINNSGMILLWTLNGDGFEDQAYLLVPKSDRLGVDFDRNGVIDTSRDTANPDRELVRRQLPWFFWVNDDNDADETDGNDIPGAGANGQDDHVNGTRDLVDFFPVHLDIADLLSAYPPSDPTITYKLAQADGAANFLTTDLTPATAGNYHSDADKAVTLGNATVTPITAGGVPLDPAFLGRVLTDDQGIILVEARKATTAPLRLEVWRGTELLSKVELPLSFAGVEQMFRHVNLTGAVGITPETYTRGGAPNWPDELNNKQAFVFAHGYNVNQKQARGSQAEFFKRLWWSGSRAQFWGVTWYGFESQVPVAGFAPDLQSNVVSAFGTAPQFKEFITELRQETQFTDISVAAHSLGNAVVSSAISDHGAQITRYFLLDAAVPSEAYDAGEAEPNDASAIMPHTEWNREHGVYHSSLWVTNWSGFFPTTDVRSQLTWRDRFRPKSSPNFSTDYYDFHSSGEEVLALDDGLTPSMTGIIFSQLWNYLENILPGREGQPAGTKSWVYQEKLKGRLIAGKIASSKFGGWGFNSFHFKKSPGGAGGKGPVMTPAVLTPDEASGMLSTVFTPEALREEPFFRPGGNRVKVASWLRQPDGRRKFTTERLGALYGPGGSDFALRHRDTLLARMIPSMSLATGRVAVERLTPQGSEERNFDMSSPAIRGLTEPWPAERTDKNWWHSDFRRVAYPYVRGFYKKIVELGELDDVNP